MYHAVSQEGCPTSFFRCTLRRYTENVPTKRMMSPPECLSLVVHLSKWQPWRRRSAKSSERSNVIPELLVPAGGDARYVSLKEMKSSVLLKSHSTLARRR